MAGLQLWRTFILKADDLALPFGCANYLFVAIVVAEIDERFYLDKRVKPAVIHTKTKLILSPDIEPSDTAVFCWDS